MTSQDTRNAPSAHLRIIIVVGVLVLVATIVSLSDDHQPSYQGRSLTTWLDELTCESAPHPITVTPGMLSERRQRAVVAIRGMGTNTLPSLVRFLSASPNPSAARRELAHLLQKQSLITLRLPAIPDRRGQSVEAFRVLRCAAAPALPELAALLESGTNYWSVDCLKAIGPASAPFLIRALNATNLQVVRMAIQTLGEFGSDSQAAVPQIASFAGGPDTSLAYGALQVLGEIDPDPRRFIALFEAKLHDTNLVPAASFSLGRLGPEGIRPLVAALAGENSKVRVSAAAALAPMVRSARRELYPTNYSFQGAVCIFNSSMLSCSSKLFKHRDDSSVVVPAVMAVFSEADATVRVSILELCAKYGASGASAIGHGMVDECAQVRQRASELTRDLGIEISGGAVVRGPVREKQLCFIFMGREFAEDGIEVLDALHNHNSKASFFLTTAFLSNTNCLPLVQRMLEDGHYLGLHSDGHIRQGGEGTLEARRRFLVDLMSNRDALDFAIDRIGAPPRPAKLFLSGYETQNLESADWAKSLGLTLVNPTRRLHPSDRYTSEEGIDSGYSQAKLDSIIRTEREDPNGLNGFLLPLHLGRDPHSTNNVAARVSELLDYVKSRGYELVRIDDLLQNR